MDAARLYLATDSDPRGLGDAELGHPGRQVVLVVVEGVHAVEHPVAPLDLLEQAALRGPQDEGDRHDGLL